MAEKITPSTAAREAANQFVRGNGPWKPEDVNLPDDDYSVQAFARFERWTLEALRTNFCPNCEAQANTIEELRSANERWVIAFKLAEERANGRIEALQAENAKLRALNQAAAECVAAMMEECARYRDEIYAALQETEQ